MRVLVIGGGIWGLACAYACALRGDQVRVYDAGRIGDGASGGVVGALGPYTPDQWNPKKQFQFDALDCAETFWTEVDQRSSRTSGYGRIGRIQPLTSERSAKLAALRMETSKTIWQGRYSWNVRPPPPLINADMAPYGVVHDTFSARIYPAKAVASLAIACHALGVEICENSPVIELQHNGVSGLWGTDTADAVILSAGRAGFDLIAPYMPLPPGEAVKGQAAILQANLTGHPQIYAEGVYIIPHTDGTVGVGSTSETTWTHEGTDSLLDDVITKAGRICPRLKNAPVLQRWAGFRPKARRRDPMVGVLPGFEGIYLALGGYKIGFGLAHKVGVVMADHIHDTPLAVPRNFTVDWHMAQ